MKILLFGTGEYYKRYKIWFEQEEVIALIDNARDKVGTFIDGKPVILPSQVSQYDFDAIFVMSFYIVEMKKQLEELGIDKSKIHHFYDIHELIYRDSLKKDIQIYNMNNVAYGKKVLLLNQDLSLGGPALALFQVAKMLRKKGYDVTYASQLDGPLREILEKEGYKVVVDVNLLVQTMNECEWINEGDYSFIICNTINFHIFLSERNTNIPMIWWLHDALFFYDGVNKKAINSISNENLKVCAVGPVSEKAIKAYRPDFIVEDLLYGVEDVVEIPKERIKDYDVIKFVTIGYIESRKGQDILVKALKLLPEEVRKKTKFSLIGKKTSMLAQKIMADCEENDEIEFIGTVDRKQINSILDECDIMICPSREDPMPTVCAEAMMHSVPCIISDSAGTVKYITNQVDGIVFKSENSEELAEKIIWIVNHNKSISKMGKGARKLYESIFDMKVFELNLMRIVRKVEHRRKIVIYGAQGVALGTYNAIKELHPEINIQCFLVTSMGNNAPTLGSVPVRELNDFIEGMSQEEKDNIEVLIGTPESVMDAIAKSLNEVGLRNYVKLDSMRWAKLQEMAFIKSGKYVPLASYPDGVHMPDIKIFKMVHQKDKELRTKYEEPEYIARLQVGAAFADRTVADLQDNTQDNISDRNGNYSELTGLYWLWKNYILAGKADNGYVGLAHYRRFLEFSDDDLKKIKDNDIDVILPYPMPYEPNIEAHHLRYLSDSEWSAVLKALEELQPEYAKAFKEILKQNYFYNYNVIVAKGEVLDNYCSWLFPLLFRIEELNDPKGVKQPNRYIGYVGETLETLYFMYNKDKLKIAHTGCRFLV